MKIFAIVGRSNSGKTRMIGRLIPELQSRGYSVAVVKHCGHGFSLDLEGKDSWQFMQSGAEGVALVSPDRLAVIKKLNESMDLSRVARKFFPKVDFVLVEGGRKDPELMKIEVIPDETLGELQSSLDELIAVVSGQELCLDKPVFLQDQVRELADFLEAHKNKRGEK